jgi:hypothetical protein
MRPKVCLYMQGSKCYQQVLIHVRDTVTWELLNWFLSLVLFKYLYHVFMTIYYIFCALMSWMVVIHVIKEVLYFHIMKWCLVHHCYFYPFIPFFWVMNLCDPQYVFTGYNLTSKIITLLEFFNFGSEVSRLQYEWSSDCWCIWKSFECMSSMKKVFSFHRRSVFVHFLGKFFEVSVNLYTQW